MLFSLYIHSMKAIVEQLISVACIFLQQAWDSPISIPYIHIWFPYSANQYSEYLKVMHTLLHLNHHKNITHKKHYLYKIVLLLPTSNKVSKTISARLNTFTEIKIRETLSCINFLHCRRKRKVEI